MRRGGLSEIEVATRAMDMLLRSDNANALSHYPQCGKNRGKPVKMFLRGAEKKEQTSLPSDSPGPTDRGHLKLNVMAITDICPPTTPICLT